MKSIGAFWRRTLVGCLAATLVIGGAAGGWAGWLHLTGNVHEVEPGALYRSAQLDAAQLSATIRQNHIRTVLNLRGANPGKSWYDIEVTSTREAGAQHVDIGMSANHVPDATTLATLIATLRTAPTPLLIHCKDGADRSGLAAALYELIVMHRTAAVADGQLSFRYGHFPWLTSHTGAMDRTFWRVATTEKPSSPE